MTNGDLPFSYKNMYKANTTANSYDCRYVKKKKLEYIKCVTFVTQSLLWTKTVRK